MKHLFSLIVTLFFINSASSAQTTAKASSNSPVCEGNALKLTAEGGTSYDWKGPDGFNSKEQNPIINNATAQKSGTYTVVVNGVSTVLVLVKVGKIALDYHNVNLSIWGTEIWVSTETNYYNSNGDIFKYSLSGPNNFKSNVRFATIAGFDKKAQGIYTSTVTDEFGCVSTASYNYKLSKPDCPYRLNILATTNFNARYISNESTSEETILCKGTGMNLQVDTTYFGVSKLQWFKDDNEIALANQTKFIAKEEGIYYLKLKSNSCEYETGRINLKYKESISTVIYSDGNTGNTALICNKGGSVKLKGGISDIVVPSMEFQWYLNNQPIEGANYRDYLAKQPGIYYLTAKGGNCTGESQNMTVKSSDKIQAKIQFDKYPDIRELNICDNNGKQFYIIVTGEGSGNVFLDNKLLYQITGRSGIETYKGGMYRFDLQQGECKSSDSILIKYGKKLDLIIDSTFYPTKCINGNNLFFSPIFSPSGSYEWFKDGKSYYPNASLYVKETGNYQLKYKNSDGCTGESKVLKVNQLFSNKSFSLELIGQGDSKRAKICRGKKLAIYSLQFDKLYSSEFDKLIWKRDGQVIPSENKRNIIVSESGKYWSEYKFDNNCVYYSDTITIEVEELPTVEIKDSCSKDNTVILKAVTNSLKIQWFENDKLLIGENSSSIKITNGNTYKIQVGENGECVAFSKPISIGLKNDNPKISICLGDTLKLTTQGNNIKSYAWTGPNNFSSTLQNITLANIKTAGVYTITATANNGCTFTNNSTVKIGDIPSFSLAKNMIVCEGQQYQFTSYKANKLTDSTETVNYLTWRGPNQFVSQQFNPFISKITDVNAGVYTATAGSYNSGCQATATTLLSIDKSGNCKSITVNLEADVFCANTNAKIAFSSTGFTTGTKFKVMRGSNNTVLGEGTQSPITIKIPNNEIVFSTNFVSGSIVCNAPLYACK